MLFKAADFTTKLNETIKASISLVELIEWISAGQRILANELTRYVTKSGMSQNSGEGRLLS